MIRSSACQRWHADQPGPMPESAATKPSATPLPATRSNWTSILPSLAMHKTSSISEASSHGRVRPSRSEKSRGPNERLLPFGGQERFATRTGHAMRSGFRQRLSRVVCVKLSKMGRLRRWCVRRAASVLSGGHGGRASGGPTPLRPPERDCHQVARDRLFAGRRCRFRPTTRR